MNALIRGSIKNPYAITVMALAVLLIGGLTLRAVPIDILPVYKNPAVQILTFYGGMPAVGMEKSITNRMERGTGMANGVARQESRSIVGVSLVRNFFQPGVDASGALTEENSLAQWEYPTTPPGTLPPVVLPFDPTGTVPVGLVALDSKTEPEQVLFDVARYQLRNMLMSNPGAIAPVVYGGKVRAIMLYLDRIRMMARQLAPTDVMQAMDNYNVFLPTGSVKIGDLDYAVTSNSMFDLVEQMQDIPLRNEQGSFSFLKDVAAPQDAAFIQSNVVRVNGRRQVYVPVYRQRGASTLTVVDTIKKGLPDMQARLTKPEINLNLVMDQSVYVRSSIHALVEEGILGAILCSLVILIFLGQWRMTLIAVITIPLSVLAAVGCLHFFGHTINVMTLAGLALAIGPLVDNAIICLENTHRHMSRGVNVREASFLGSSEVALPALVSTLCTFLVLMPLLLVPGMGDFLFGPMTAAVFFAMVAAFLLSQSLVPSFSAVLLKPHADHHHGASRSWLGRAFEKWERLIGRAIAAYILALDFVLRWRKATVLASVLVLCGVLAFFGPRLRREFFPIVDAGAFEIAVRAPTGTRIEETEKCIVPVEDFIRKTISERDLEMIIVQIGCSPDISSAYTPNAGPMDAIVKVQLKRDRQKSAQHYVSLLRKGFQAERSFSQLEFSFDAGGMISSALNEGKSSPINVRITGKNSDVTILVAEAIKRDVAQINGVVDARIIQRLNYPQLTITVDRAKSAELGLTQQDVMKNVIAACNSSIAFNKKNFWIDPVSKNQYYVGVQYPEEDIQSIESLLDIPITSPKQSTPVPLRSVAAITRSTVPSEITHSNIQATIDLTVGVEGRSLGEVADDIGRLMNKYGQRDEDGNWATFDPKHPGKKKLLTGSKISLAGEYAKMQTTFGSLAFGLVLASLLMYFLMVALDRSFIVPLTVMLTVPLSLAGVLPLLWITKTSLNVQSLLGIIFVIGIKVANTVLMTDFAQELRRHEGLSPTEAIRKAAAVRVRPVTMTALAAFFAMIPAALSLQLGSEANAPLARAILGGLLAGEPATLFFLPVIYSLLVRDGKGPKPEPHGHSAEPHTGHGTALAPA
ncbi:acriflavin resistance protein [Planctomyces sp. SCGC AG-212-M04]|nr:acriflavin resistance protein [Planctomyces sp. SCGC AG-212-M04]